MQKIKLKAPLLRRINESAIAERAKKEHPGNMHLWWNRSPIESSKILLNATIPFAGDEDELKEKITVVDPFSGFGGLVLAALDTGLPVVAGDLNSVAVTLTKAATEIPARFANKSSVSLDADNNNFQGCEGLAEDVFHYGISIGMSLEERLKSVYPDSLNANSKGQKTYAWIWTRTAPCPNPACGCRMPLANSYVLSKLKDREYSAIPEVIDHKVIFRVKKEVPEGAEKGNKIGNIGARFKCPACGEITTDAYVKEIGRNGKLAIQLMAIGYEGPAGREYYDSSDIHMAAGMSDSFVDRPVGDIANNTRWFSPPLFGKSSYADLYTPRQLLLLTTLCDLVNKTRDRVFKDAKRAGMPDDGKHLSEGGTGALAYSEAVSVYLSFVVDKVANFQSEICTWDNRNGNIRAAFTRQAIPMTWVFAEGNPFSSVTGNYYTMLQDVVRSVRNLPYKASAEVRQYDGTRFEFPKNSILVTELPFCDNVGYADLSDYFYVWMRRCLKEVYPSLFEKIVTSKEELTSIPEHYAGNMKEALESYKEGIRRLFENFSIAASRDLPSFTFYEFSNIDEQGVRTKFSVTQGLSVWETLIEAMIHFGFQILATFPVRTEKQDNRYESIRVCIIFQKLSEDMPQTTRRMFVSEIKKTLPGMLEESFFDVDSGDRAILGMGCGLFLFSGYKRIVNADGTIMPVHDALALIWTEVHEYIKAIEINNTKDEEVYHAGKL